MIARKSIATVLAIAILGLVGAAASNAAVVTIGSPLKGDFLFPSSPLEAGTYFNKRVGPDGKRVVSPTDGAVIRWRLSEGFLGGSFRLQILRPTAPENAPQKEYYAGPESAAVSPDGASATFSTVLPIKKGEVIGLLGGGPGVQFGIRNGGGGLYEEISPPLILGGQPDSGVFGPIGEELGFNADILPVPTVTGISPTGGPAAGGTKVTISGTSFAKVTKVSFGAAAATSYKVESEGKIVATAPAGKPSQAVKVSVTTVAGTASAPKQFTYAAKTAAAATGKSKKP